MHNSARSYDFGQNYSFKLFIQLYSSHMNNNVFIFLFDWCRKFAVILAKIIAPGRIMHVDHLYQKYHVTMSYRQADKCRQMIFQVSRDFRIQLKFYGLHLQIKNFHKWNCRFIGITALYVIGFDSFTNSRAGFVILSHYSNIQNLRVVGLPAN